MSSPFPRRAVLTAGAATAAAAAATVGLAPAALAKGPERSAPFSLDAEVLDGGEQIVSVTIDATRRGGLPTGELPTSTFTVHARGTDRLRGSVAYDLDRTVTAVTADHHGRITVDLEHGFGVDGASTLAYIGSVGRNVQLDLEYTITQNEPLPLHGKGVPQISSFIQGDLVSPEVDAFTSRVSASGTNYRLFSPAQRGKKAELPLVVWLHGGGEGGVGKGGADYYDNETQLRANRGALGPATKEAQELFGGAYVVAPQCTSAWMADGDAFEPLIDEIIEEVAASHRIDRDRVHVTGCSNGGYMTLKMIVENPGAFASAVPICCAVEGRPTPLVSDGQLEAVTTPTWLIAAANDDTINPQANSVHAHELIDESILSLYDTVTWEGVDYPGHWSWIYAARNDPSHDGVSLWEWMAEQQL